MDPTLIVSHEFSMTRWRDEENKNDLIFYILSRLIDDCCNVTWRRKKQILTMFISYHYQMSKTDINHLCFLPPGGKRLSTHWCLAQLARLSLTHRPEILVTLAHLLICTFVHMFAYLYIFIFAHLYICLFAHLNICIFAHSILVWALNIFFFNKYNFTTLRF